MNWQYWFYAAGAAYLFFFAFMVDTSNLRSAFIFKFVPFAIGLPIAFAVAARVLGWPV
jgi:hypothetical protein